MDSIKTAHLVYFSGTGGTARVTNCLEQAFLRHNIAVKKTELDAKVHEWVYADLTVLSYPVYACGAPVSVDEWIDRAPDGNGAAVAVMSVSGGGEMTPNTACRAGVIRKLEKKGYRVLYESMFVMPANCIARYDDALSAMLLEAAPAKAEKVVSDILSGKTKRTTPSPVNRLIAKVCTVEKHNSARFGKRLKATDDCIGCGWCAASCPRGNIIMKDGKPRFDNRCVICLRCVYGCPKKAIQPGIGKRFIFQEGYSLNEIEKRASQMKPFPPVSEVAKGLMYQGVRSYLNEIKPQ